MPVALRSFQVMVVAIACLAFSAHALAENSTPQPSVRVSATVSMDEVRVAEPFVLELKVVTSIGDRVQFPAVGQNLGPFDVVSHQDVPDIPSSENRNQRIWTRRLTLESVVTGELTIPPQEIQIASDSDSQIVRSEAVSVHVISVLEGRADATRLRDIHNVVDVAVPKSESGSRVIWWIAGGGGILALVVASVVLVARRKNWLSPSRWALSELDSLKHSDAFQLADSEAVSRQIAMILCNYLELMFDLATPVQTTRDLRDVACSMPLIFDADVTRRIIDLFETADQAKFAALQLSPAELNSAIDEARQLVVETSQRATVDAAKLKGTS